MYKRQDAIRAMPKLKKEAAAGVLDQAFKERIMLAVTEVNGCAMCSYAHTQMALEAGLSSEDVYKRQDMDTIYLLHGAMEEPSVLLSKSTLSELADHYQTAVILPAMGNGFYVDAAHEFLCNELVKYCLLYTSRCV